jgi:hypothetical protein
MLPLAPALSQHEFPHFDGPNEIVPVSARRVLVRTLYGGSLMRMVTRIFPLAALAFGLSSAPLSAQQPGNGAFQWYIGGQGGIMNFETGVAGRKTQPMAGAHMLITARRTGLLISVDQNFGPSVATAYTLQTFDTTGTLVSSEIVPLSFKYLRRYSAMLVAFPIKGPITPYFGVGVGIQHTGGHNPDDDFAKSIGSSGFGSFVGGLNFRVSRFSAFGQYQVTTGPSLQSTSVQFDDKSAVVAFGNLFHGPVHTFSAGLRFGLGNAKERAVGGGY